MGDNAYQWILERNLSNVFKELKQAYLKNPSSINGKIMAHVVYRLITNEVSPGGPYKDLDGRVYKSANQQIKRFLFLTELTSPHEPRMANRVGVINASKEYKPILDSIIDGVISRIKDLPTPVCSEVMLTFNKLKGANIFHEVALISSYFNSPSEGNLKNPWIHIELGIANIFLWMAYTGLDDLYDGDEGPVVLPQALVSMRIAKAHFEGVATGRESNERIARIFDEMDNASCWEMKFTRANITGSRIEIQNIPNYGNGSILAKRSLGHILGPLLLARRSRTITSQQLNKIELALRHYLIARQLNDDLHDWHKDLTEGQLSYVMAHLLKNTKVVPGVYGLQGIAKTLEKYFWKNGLFELCEIVIKHTHRSKECLEQAGIRISPELESLINRLEEGALESIRLHNNQKDFVKTYRRLVAKPQQASPPAADRS